MQIFWKKVEAYGKMLWGKKGRLFGSLLISGILFTISCYYMYDGINKRFFVFSMLSLCTGIFLTWPKPDGKVVSFLLVFIYLIWVPMKMFERMELPIHDMGRIQEGVKFASILIILLIYAVFLLIFQNTGLAFGFGGIVFLLLFLVNYYVIEFRGTSLSISDILATGTALTVIGNYRLSLSAEQWYSILYFCFFISFGFKCGVPIKKKRHHLIITTIAMGYCLFFYGFWSSSGYLEKYGLVGHYWNGRENEELNGLLLSFGISIREMSMERPAGYSEDRLLQIAEQAEKEYALSGGTGRERPNIILIMNEAWSDLRVLGELETSKPYMPFFDSLVDNAVKGNVYVEILGGITANTEFEVLTGDSLAFLASSVVPYQMQVNHGMYSLARVLGEQGYQTMAMHPSVGSAWNREHVYECFGFEDFIELSEFETEFEYVGNFLSDECNFKEIIRRYEQKREDAPFFLFDVTIQNHADYYGNTEILLNIEKIGNVDAEEAGYIYDAETYLNLMKVTDDAFKELVEYFQNVDEPTIICMFGDHQPNLGSDFYDAMFRGSGLSEEESQARKYQTPYIIWANYDTDFRQYGDMSANYLGAAVLECADVELPVYYKFLLELRKQYPEISYRTIERLREEERVQEYQMMQYNHLMEKKYKKSLFSVL